MWTTSCNVMEPTEFETGVVLINKAKAWRGLSMTAFINKNHHYYMQHIIYGDKQTFMFGFQSTNTSYYMVPHFPYGFGRFIDDNDKRIFVADALCQRHPSSGRGLFAHRNRKFNWLIDFIGANKITWSHYSEQLAKVPWRFGPIAQTYIPDGTNVAIRPIPRAV
jgi:hypothetical protein